MKAVKGPQRKDPKKKKKKKKDKMSDIDEIKENVQKLLNNGKNNKALKLLLEDPPVTSKDQDIKVCQVSLSSRRAVTFFQ